MIDFSNCYTLYFFRGGLLYRFIYSVRIKNEQCICLQAPQSLGGNEEERGCKVQKGWSWTSDTSGSKQVL